MNRTSAVDFSQSSLLTLAHIDPKDKITGCELYAKSAAALTLGIVPFAIAKIGQGLSSAFAFLAQEGETALNRMGSFGSHLGKAWRCLVGLPALASGMLLYVGSRLFALTQKLIWGTKLVNHPQEERVNTKLARYGAGDKPLADFHHLFDAFYHASPFIRQEQLTRFRGFTVP
jgi:hypothetical protein